MLGEPELSRRTVALDPLHRRNTTTASRGEEVRARVAGTAVVALDPALDADHLLHEEDRAQGAAAARPADYLG